MDGGEREIAYGDQCLLPLLLIWPQDPTHSGCGVTQGNMDQPSKNGEQSTTVTKLLPGPYVTAPYAKLEIGRHTPEEPKYTHPMAQSHYYGGFVPYSKAIRMGSVNEYGGGQAPRVALPSKIVEKERIGEDLLCQCKTISCQITTQTVSCQGRGGEPSTKISKGVMFKSFPYILFELDRL